MGICILCNGDSLLVDGHCQNISSDYSILKKALCANVCGRNFINCNSGIGNDFFLKLDQFQRGQQDPLTETDLPFAKC